jgi:hypothetical protein
MNRENWRLIFTALLVVLEKLLDGLSSGKEGEGNEKQK